MPSLKKTAPMFPEIFLSCKHFDIIAFLKTSISLKRHSSPFWKPFQISSNYFSCYIHFTMDSRAARNLLLLLLLLFHFWRHHLWPNLASSIVNFWNRPKRSFQLYRAKIDRPYGGLNMNENDQKFKWKPRKKIPATTCGYSMVKITHLDLDDAF